jgi:hypothetical protein
MISHLGNNVKAFLEKTVGHVSRNNYFGIEAANMIEPPVHR